MTKEVIIPKLQKESMDIYDLLRKMNEKGFSNFEVEQVLSISETTLSDLIKYINSIPNLRRLRKNYQGLQRIT